MIRFQYKKEDFRLDITPLIDVIFLVIIFLILNLGSIYSFLQMELPRLEEEFPSSSAPVNRIVLQKHQDAVAIFWNGEKIPLEDLQLIEKKMQEATQKKVIIDADKEITYGLLLQVLAKLKKVPGVEVYFTYEKE